MRRISMTLVVVLTLITLQDTPTAAPARAIFDLGGIAGRANWAMDINAHGDVVGIGAFQSEWLEETRALLWSRGTLVALPPLAGDVASLANAVNNRRQVVGHSVNANYRGTPVLWDRGRAIALGALPGQVSGGALDVNDRGEVVGAVSLYDDWLGQQRAFVWRNGVIRDLFPPSVTWSSAVAINNHGQIVGQAFGTMLVREGHVYRSIELAGGYIWDRGKVTPLDSLGGPNLLPQDINDRGEVTGTADNRTGEYHVFLWRRGQLRDIGTLTSGHAVGLGLNNVAEVVGQADPGVAFLWRRGHMHDLGFFESEFSRAEAINQRGDVIGLGYDWHGEKHAVIWTDRAIAPLWINPGQY